MRIRILSLVVALSSAFLCAPSSAMPIIPTSYDMPNGGGHASGGTFNYWDLNYSGMGATSTDGAPLSGGLGDLTDGVIATDFWFNVEDHAGTGPYVGWYGPGPMQLNPVLTFNFSGNPLIDEIIVHFDNSTVGGVFSPENILIDGNDVGYVAPGPAGLYAYSLSGLGLVGGQHTIQFLQAFGGNSWTFVSEIEFFGTVTPVAEPCGLALMLAGVGAARARLRRRAR